jgi:signal transduction histidine kinase
MIRSSRLPWLVWTSSIVLLLGELWLGSLNDRLRDELLLNLMFIGIIVGYSTVGAVLASRNPSNTMGWLMLVVGLALGLSAFSDDYLVYAVDTRPGSLPGAAAAAMLSGLAWVPLLVVLILIVLLFPTGRVPGPRWRFLPWTIAGLFALATAGSIVAPGPLDVGVRGVVENPFGVEALGGAAELAQTIGFLGLLPALAASILALVLRYRRSRGEERQQIRWLVYVVAVVGVAILVGLVQSLIWDIQALDDALFILMVALIGLGVPVAIGVAILRYRLYDLDLVIRKTVLYATVALVLVAIFFVFAIGVGQALIEADPGAIVASIAMGLLVWPAVRLARRIADRVVYGRRATPYEVLTDFSRRLGGSYASEDVLPRMAAILGEGVGASRALVWLRVGREWRSVGVAPLEAEAPEPVRAAGDRMPALPADASVEVRDQGELLGALTVSMPANDPMGPSKERLVRDLASQAGLVLRNVRLIEELRASRQRLVAAQDEARRRLERNIHDGAQQQLVALSVKLRLLEQIAVRDPARVAEMATQLQADTTETLEDLRDLARGIYPPLLADKGLSAALEAQARKSTLPVTVEAPELGRFPQDVEAAIYFSCLEALQNVAKYAEASHVTISLSRSNGRLSFSITDDGVGFDPDATNYGTGLQGIADRIDALDGTFELVSSVSAGTTVHGSVPIATPRPAPAEPAGEDQAAPRVAAHASSSRSGPKTDLGM